MRRILFILGLTTLAATWFGPLPRLAQQAFAAHMTMHMAVVALAAPLLALGLADSRFDPVAKLPRLFAPIPASVLELLAVWAWHAPALHHAARHTTAGLIAEQATFLIAGWWVWLSVCGAERAHTLKQQAAGIIALLLTSMHMTLLGALFALASRPLFAHAHAHDALADQHLGGAIMILIGGVSYLAGGLWLAFRLLRGEVLTPQEAA
jgi:putative membrane protein